MRWMKCVCLGLFVLMAAQGVAMAAAEGARPYQIYNRMRLELDDNVYASGVDPQESLKFIEEVEFLVNFNLPQTYISLRYRPSYVWWEKREPDDSDFQNDLDLVLNHEFSTRMTLSVIDTLRRGELPDLMDQNVIVSQEDFYYNSINGTLGYMFRPTTKLEPAVRYTIVRYDNEELSLTEDYDLLVGGLSLRHQLVPSTTVIGEFRYSAISYVEEQTYERGSTALAGGGAVEQIFSPALVGSARAGLEQKSYDAEELGDSSAPYAEASLTFLPSPRTRLSAGAGYSFFESDVQAFANQTRSIVFLSLAHDLTAKVSWYLSGGYTIGEYSIDESPDPAQQFEGDGEEDTTQVSTRLTYKVNRSNLLEAGWQYVNLGSDLRVEYDRNRFDVGWKYQF